MTFEEFELLLYGLSNLQTSIVIPLDVKSSFYNFKESTFLAYKHIEYGFNYNHIHTLKHLYDHNIPFKCRLYDGSVFTYRNGILKKEINDLEFYKHFLLRSTEKESIKVYNLLCLT